jgi:hypothetical protein
VAERIGPAGSRYRAPVFIMCRAIGRNAYPFDNTQGVIVEPMEASGPGHHSRTAFDAGFCMILPRCTYRIATSLFL